ncbi:hypothetical protein D3C81_754420 [compost metagenome]
MCQPAHHFALLVTQARQQFTFQVLAEQWRWLGMIQRKRQANTGAPPACLMPEFSPGQRIGVWRKGANQRFELIGAKGQLWGTELLQLTGQHQTRQIPVRTLATGDQHLHLRVFEGQELVEPVVEVGGHIHGKVVEHQADRAGFVCFFCRQEFVACNGPFAGKPAPTVDRVPLWERACSRKR